MEWSQERIARLKELWAQGRSASEIAAYFGGMTRNAVIGKVHRLGLTARRTKAEARADNSAKMKRARAAARPPTPKSCAARINPKVEKIATLVVSNAVSEPLTKAMLIDALTARTRKWMDGDPKRDGTYCGHETLLGAPYCPYHYIRAHYKGSQADFDRIAARTMRGSRDVIHVILAA